jgi:hypothetical protein
VEKQKSFFDSNYTTAAASHSPLYLIVCFFLKYLLLLLCHSVSLCLPVNVVCVSDNNDDATLSCFLFAACHQRENDAPADRTRTSMYSLFLSLCLALVLRVCKVKFKKRIGGCGV